MRAWPSRLSQLCTSDSRYCGTRCTTSPSTHCQGQYEVRTADQQGIDRETAFPELRACDPPAGLTRTPSSASSRSKVGRSANGPGGRGDDPGFTVRAQRALVNRCVRDQGRPQRLTRAGTGTGRLGTCCPDDCIAIAVSGNSIAMEFSIPYALTIAE